MIHICSHGVIDHEGTEHASQGTTYERAGTCLRHPGLRRCVVTEQADEWEWVGLIRIVLVEVVSRHVIDNHSSEFKYVDAAVTPCERHVKGGVRIAYLMSVPSLLVRMYFKVYA